MPSEILGVAPWVIIAAVASWFASMYANREKRLEKTADSEHRLIIHRDELTFDLLQTARGEMSAARVEVDGLREEVKKLRAMENHFYHFQQSLEHLEALLFADTPDTRAAAERNARAFLNRMRRLSEAKGTIANEAQRAASSAELMERTDEEGKKDG